MKVTLTVEVEVRFVSGKFAPKDEIVEALRAEIEGADPGSFDALEGEYEVESWDVVA